jgi:hypothetical protein
MRPATRWWVLGGSFAVAGVAGGLIGAAIASPGSSSAAASSGNAAAGSAGAAESCAVSPVAGRVLPSVVTISKRGAGS